jgi:hypothetical protein
MGRARLQVRGMALLRGIEDIAQALEAGSEATADGSRVPLDVKRVRALSVAIQAKLKLLDKVLPDLAKVDSVNEAGAGHA